MKAIVRTLSPAVGEKQLGSGQGTWPSEQVCHHPGVK